MTDASYLELDGCPTQRRPCTRWKITAIGHRIREARVQAD